MKNKSLILTLLMLTVLIVSSCAGSRGGYSGGHRKGYGCPATASVAPQAAATYSI